MAPKRTRMLAQLAAVVVLVSMAEPTTTMWHISAGLVRVQNRFLEGRHIARVIELSLI